MKFEWEVIFNNERSTTSRAKVPGGWLVNTVILIKGVPATSTSFVKDPEWYWDLT